MKSELNKRTWLSSLLLLVALGSYAQMAAEDYLCFSKRETAIPVFQGQELVPIVFYEEDYKAVHFTKVNNTDNINWQVIPNMGRTSSALTVVPCDAPQQKPGSNTPYVEYEFTLFDRVEELKVETYLSPTLNYKKNEGLKYAIAIDDETPQIINMHEGETKPDWEYPAWWNNSVTDHIKKKMSIHQDLEAGRHRLKVWIVDPGMVFQKFVIDAGGLRSSYLGPPESIRK